MLVLRIRGVLQSLRHMDNSMTTDQSRVVGTSSAQAQMEAEGTGGSSRHRFRLFHSSYYLTHCLCQVKHNCVAESAYRRDNRKAQKDTKPPLREGLGLQEQGVYFSASQTSSSCRFIQ